MRNRSWKRRSNQKALLMRITRHLAATWPKPPKRQPKFGRSSPDVGTASISKRRGVVWDDGGEGAINEPARPDSRLRLPALAAAGTRAQERFIEFFTASCRRSPY